jgi:exosome complex component RRP42
VAETDILPSANGSARVCFADGTEAIVGVKAEVEKSQWRPATGEHGLRLGSMDVDDDDQNEDGDGQGRADAARGVGRNEWVEMSIEVPGYRDDDALPTFLAAMLTEALLASGELKDRLWINRRFHWKLYIDILLLSPPLSYPLPLLSLTTHLALLSARLPRLKSELDEDPLFDDDWEASTYLYPYSHNREQRLDRPPITLLVITVGSNIIFDPSREELAVAEALLALSVGMPSSNKAPSHQTGSLTLLAIRTIDPPSRLTPPGIPNSNDDGPAVSREETFAAREIAAAKKECWSPPRGGINRGLLNAIVKMTIENGGVAEDMLTGLVRVQS